MQTSVHVTPEVWAERQFGEVELGDARRTRRAVRVAAQMACHPAASLPEQAGDWAATKAGYRLFSEEDVTFEALSVQHWQQTRQEAASQKLMLMIQDTSGVDYSHLQEVENLGPIGDNNGRGFMLHSTLAVGPRNGYGEVFGLAYQMLFCRRPTPADETRTERKHRERESEIWRTSVREISSPPPESAARYVHVCDRYADDFETYNVCRQTPGVDFVIRSAQNRRAALGHEAEYPNGYLLDLARSLPRSGQKELLLRRRPQREPRCVSLQVASSPVTVFPPHLGGRGVEPFRGWVVRAWELDTPAEEDPIEWILLTSVPVSHVEMALTILFWYSLRWLVEEYHKCLKTGCAVEKRQLKDGLRLKPCIAIAAVAAVRLLQLKQQVRICPDQEVTKCGPADHVRVLAAYLNRAVEGWTVREFWRAVARLGGFLARKSDGEPGWLTIWRGWQKLDLMAVGARLAQPEAAKCG